MHRLGSRPLVLLALLSTPLAAQQRPPQERPAPASAAPAGAAPVAAPAQRASVDPAGVRIIADTTIRSTDNVTIKGKPVPYRVTVGTQPVWDDKNVPIASMFYTYYERTDVTNRDARPLVISFNGGPGSASVWMHIAYTGPKQLRIDDEGYPVQPYGVQDNPNSILDVADIVYIDPVNTGFSRIIGDAKREQFFGVNEDIAYLARWVDAFVTRQGRWTSPKYLIGESYGTTRVAGLVSRLQSSHWMFFNGVILVSPTGLGVERDGPVSAALRLPYFTATAWYHKALPADLQGRDLEQLLPEVESWTIDKLLPGIARGGSLPSAQRTELVKQFARYSGLSESAVSEHALAVPTQFFWKELLRTRGVTVGRLDSRYQGLDRTDAGDAPDFDPALTAWNHAFAPAINHYLRDQLKFRTDLQYWLFGPVNPWNRSGEQTGEQLRRSMSENPYLHLMVQSGYYDGGTDYFNAKYSMWNLDPAGRVQDRMTWKGYRSGHMMYLRRDDLATSNEDIRQFIARTTPKAGQPAKR
ncbi:MAG: carboxypeptidase [Gemmatimonadetes bacterium]|nr:carboxypeptidase [Gemmatimonadota bacterium]